MSVHRPRFARPPRRRRGENTPATSPTDRASGSGEAIPTRTGGSCAVSRRSLFGGPGPQPAQGRQSPEGLTITFRLYNRVAMNDLTGSLARTLAALADPHRLAIVGRLMEGEADVADLTPRLGISQP